MVNLMTEMIHSINFTSSKILEERAVIPDGTIRSININQTNGYYVVSKPYLNKLTLYPQNIKNDTPVDIVNLYQYGTFDTPLDAKFDSARNKIWVADSGNNRILRIDGNTFLVDFQVQNIFFPIIVTPNENTGDCFVRAFEDINNGTIYVISQYGEINAKIVFPCNLGFQITANVQEFNSSSSTSSSSSLEHSESSSSSSKEYSESSSSSSSSSMGYSESSSSSSMGYSESSSSSSSSSMGYSESSSSSSTWIKSSSLSSISSKSSLSSQSISSQSSQSISSQSSSSSSTWTKSSSSTLNKTSSSSLNIVTVSGLKYVPLNGTYEYYGIRAFQGDNAYSEYRKIGDDLARLYYINTPYGWPWEFWTLNYMNSNYPESIIEKTYIGPSESENAVLTRGHNPIGIYIGIVNGNKDQNDNGVVS